MDGGQWVTTNLGTNGARRICLAFGENRKLFSRDVFILKCSDFHGEFKYAFVSPRQHVQES